MKQSVILAALLLVISACSSLPGHFVSLRTEEDIPFARVLEDIAEERVIFVGEMHGDRQSHTVEFEVVRYLHERGDAVVVAFEMFPSSEQELLDQWVGRTITEQEFVGRYHRVVNLPFAVYAKILRYAREKGIPVVGINADRNLISAVSKDGTGSISHSVLETVKFKNCAEDDEYSRMLGFSRGKQYHQGRMAHICDGQRLRDAYMSYHIAGILKKGDEKVVVMTGVFHAVKAAVPGMLQDHIPVSYRVMMPAKARHMVQSGADEEIADYVWY